MVRDLRTRGGRIVKRNRRRYPLVDGSTLDIVTAEGGQNSHIRERDEAEQYARQVIGGTTPVRGQFPLPAWVTRGRQRSQVTGNAPRRESAESPGRMELLADEPISTNAVLASPGSLLRARARDVAHRRNKLLRILRNECFHPFTWITPEGNGNRLERTDVLRRYIDRIVVDVNEIECGIYRNSDAMRRLRLAD